MIYITGDKHREFDSVKAFCQENNTTKNDVLIVLGDAGLNYYLDQKDRDLKDRVASLPITLFCIHGNHEERPAYIFSYTCMKWHEGTVYLEYEYPNILFAKDGEIYDLNGKKAIVIGGAYSVDKNYRLATGMTWFKSEQPDKKIKKYFELQLKKSSWKIDCVLSHTCPKKLAPIDLLEKTLDLETFDYSTEEWLDEIEDKLEYSHWSFGHFHTEKTEANYSIHYENIEKWNY